MESKHTPGPWYVHDATSIDRFSAKQIGTYDIKTTPPGQFENSLWLADTKPYGGDSFTNKEIAKANAYLMAAAPDMYEVISALYDYCKQTGASIIFLDKIEAAYLKATGQPINL